MLNKAEALVRKSSPGISGAMSVVNELRRNRLAPDTPGLELSASGADQALRLILEERRRELAFTYRWWDIRRFGVNENAADDVTVTRTFYPIANGLVQNEQAPTTYTWGPGSRKFAVPINGVEIDNSNDIIKQNPY